MSSSSDELSSDASIPDHDHFSSRPFTGFESSSDEESDDANVPLVEMLRTEFCKSFSRAQVMTAVIKMDGLGLNHSDARIIAFNLRQFTRLRTLSLNWNQVKHGASFIDELLRVNSCIRRMSMNGNDIQCNGAKHLAGTLKCSDCKVRELEIEDNGIASAGAISLASSLKVNTSIRKLTLRGNPIGDRGAEALSTVLVGNTTLKVLRVDECGITRTGAISLLGVVGRTPRLMLFDLSGNKLCTTSLPRAPLVMSPSSALRELIIRFARLDDSDLVQLSFALLESPRLETLSLDGNSLTDSSCDLLRTLLVNCPLCSLNLSANQFGCRTAAVLLRASLDCERIVRLNFGTNNPCGTPSECGKSPDWKTCGLPALPEHFEVDTWAAASRHCRIMLHIFAADAAARAKSRILLQMQLRLSKDLSESEAEMLKTSDWWLHVFSKHNCPPELVSAVFQSRLTISLQKQ
jgi:Ran GTPase-activating protein (RanGAP) involved in mRNA processing and transport